MCVCVCVVSLCLCRVDWYFVYAFYSNVCVVIFDRNFVVVVVVILVAVVVVVVVGIILPRSDPNYFHSVRVNVDLRSDR